MSIRTLLGIAFLIGLAGSAAGAAAPGTPVPPKPDDAAAWSGLAFRSLGPAVTEGRVVDIAVDPARPATWYVAAASGGVWKTSNAGNTWAPVFEGEGSYSIGCIAIDPRNPSTVWVGTGENNSQRAVAYGDGVYRSDDGGHSWKNMGLKASEHIGAIAIDPNDSEIVYVAAQGPLWSPGGDRGLYKTVDGGKSWKAVLTVSENTGISQVALDPRNSRVLYAAAYQRRRHVWTLIDGGPESAIYRSTDAGVSWQKTSAGLPAEDLGRIGLAISPVDPDVVYAIVEAANHGGGFYRSTNRGGSWEKRSDFTNSAPMAYNVIFADPKLRDRVYAMDVSLEVSDDAGKTFHDLGEADKHPDNHVIRIDPADNDHYLVGCDGGVYESFDRGTTWNFKANLPITQFYRVAVDDDSPVYHVYGGTQDNESLGGPSRVPGLQGITNADWFVTSVGDGFVSAVDPEDPNIVYSEAQYGALNRMDRRTGEQLYIQPQPGKGEEGLRWNWDSPLLISPHSHTRLYFAANRLFRSDDRGGSWKPVSGDLTRRLDRNAMKVMGRIWPADAVSKNSYTSVYGNIVSLSESPLAEGLLYVGTDDGLVQASEDGGRTWRREERFPGVPEMTYVSRLRASSHDRSRVYAAFDNHNMGDFRPYLLVSRDRGRSWSSIAGDLPQRGSVYAFAEDPVDPTLLFVGTEFGLFFSQNGGGHWVPLKGGLPTIAVRDIAIQKRENDLVLATFGRGFYVLDDYSPLRLGKPEERRKDFVSFPVKTAKLFVPPAPFGVRGRAFLGASFYAADNPPFGVVLTYALKEDVKTRVKARHDRERDAEKSGSPAPYPSLQDFRDEAAEEAPAILMTIADAEGNTVRTLSGPATAGIHRVAWDLRYPPSDPTSLVPPIDNPFVTPPQGPLAVPGRYTVAFSRRVEGKLIPLGSPQAFDAVGAFEISAGDRKALLAFERKTARLQRAVLGTLAAAREAGERLRHIKQALIDTPGAPAELSERARSLEAQLRAIRLSLSGDPIAAERYEATPPSIADRVGIIVATHWGATAAPTGSSLEQYELASADFAGRLAEFQAFERSVRELESRMEAAGAPWTPGRVPTWKPE